MKKVTSNYHENFSCVAENELYRPVCPLMSHHYPHADSTFCKGPFCVFCRDGDCLIAKSLETYIKSKDPLVFISDENLNEIESMV